MAQARPSRPEAEPGPTPSPLMPTGPPRAGQSPSENGTGRSNVLAGSESNGAVCHPAGVVAALVPPRLRFGDRVRLVSPASRPDREQVARGAELLTSWGLEVELGRHVFDSYGHYLAGRDEDRLADLNDALHDPGVRAILATTGGKGAYRIASGLDFTAARRDPKPLVGFSDNTILHLALWQRCRIVGFHGPHAGWQDWYGQRSAEALRQALMEPDPVSLSQDRRS